MPIPNWGPKKGQWISKSEMQGYYAANLATAAAELGSDFTPDKMWSPDPRDAADEADYGYETERQYREEVGAAPQTREEYDRLEAERQARIAAMDASDEESKRQRALAAGAGAAYYNQPGVWDEYYSAGMAAAPMTMPGFDTTNQDQARIQQAQVIQELQRQAAGDLNSLAQQQLSRMYGEAKAQQSSLGSTIRGQSSGAAMRNIAAGQQGIQRGLAGDQQMLQLQEQQAAQAMLAQLLGQQRGQDVEQAEAMARGQLQGDALNEAMRQFYLSGRIGRLGSNYQYGADLAGAKLGMDLQRQDLVAKRQRDLANAAASGIGTLASMDWGGGGGGGSNGGPRYRQVDGQDSIVPIDDK